MKNPIIFSKREEADPESDWKIIFSIAFFLVLIALGFSVYMYLKIDKGEIFVVDGGEESGQTLDLEKIDAAAKYYENKGNNLQNILKSSTTTVSDPSI
jgi:hypothetical protein